MPNMKLKTASTPIKKTNSGATEGSEGVTGMKIEFIMIEEESIIDSYSSDSNSDSDSDRVEATNDGESDSTIEENKEDEPIKVEIIEEEVKNIPWTYWRSTEPSVGNIDIDPESIRRDLLAQSYTNEGEIK